jgi:DNA-binding response OmpR family regulator
MSSSPHILVVDADADVHRSIAGYLGEFDFRVSGAPDGNAMRGTPARHVGDVILLDLKHPAEGGMTVVQGAVDANLVTPPAARAY